MTDLIELTMDYWKKEDCARSTSCGLLDYNNYTSVKNIMYKAILPFAEGTGERSICGSISGSLASLSFILSERGLTKSELRKHVSKFKEQFTSEFGTLRCRDLLNPYLGEDAYPPDPVRLEICTKTVERSVHIAQGIIENTQK
ncbi:MAG: C-GCAxxG-C-C family protein [Candidatus Kariarchaeaceae archaeon]